MTITMEGHSKTSMNLSKRAGDEYIIDLLNKGTDVSTTNRYGDTLIHLAARYGSPYIVSKLLKIGANVNTNNIHGVTPLHLAAECGNLPTLELLLHNDAVVNIKNKEGDSPLHVAINSKNIDILEQLINKGADVNATNNTGNSTLHLAIAKKEILIIRLLLNRGADINLINHDGTSPVNLAAQYEENSIADLMEPIQRAPVGVIMQNQNTQLQQTLKGGDAFIVDLLNVGADVNSTNRDGDSLLHLVIRYGSLRIILLLLNAGAEVNAKNKYGATPLVLAVVRRNPFIVKLLLNRGAVVNTTHKDDKSPLHFAAVNGDSIIVKLLLDRGADINYMNIYSKSPLHFAIENGHYPTVKLLLDKGANFKKSDIYEKPLHLAVEKGYSNIVELFLNRGDDINSTNSDNDSLLHLAAENGHLHTLELLLKKDADKNMANMYGLTPLHYATMKGHLKIVETLLDNGVEFNKTCKEGQLPLHLAAIDGHFNIAEVLVNKGAEINTSDSFGNTPLHLAAVKGRLQISELLLNKGAELQITNKKSETPLHLAAESGHLTIVQLLLNKNVDINTANRSGYLPLHFAAHCGSLPIVKMLLSKGSDVTKITEYGHTPLHLAAKSGHLTVVEMLLNAGAEVNSIDSNAESPLHYAAQRGHLTTVELLLTKGALFDTMNVNEETPLFLATKRNHIDTVEMLLNKGADVNTANKNGDTMIHLAAQSDHYQIMKLLIDKGAKVNKINKYGNSPLHLAAQKGHTRVIELLLNHNAEFNAFTANAPSPLHFAAERGDHTTLKLILKKGAACNSPYKYHNSPLHLAAKNGHFSAVNLLIHKFTDFSERNKDGFTPLHLAVLSKDLKTVDLLLTKGADINIMTHIIDKLSNEEKDSIEMAYFKRITPRNGLTPLHLSAFVGDLPISELLLCKGATLNQSDENGDLPIHLAAKNGRLSIVELLLNEGADFNRTNFNGELPLYLAAKNLHLSVVELLLYNGADVNTTYDYGNTLLHLAAMKGNVSSVNLMLDKGIDVNATNDNGSTSLHFALTYGDKSIVDLLLQRGADFNKTKNNGSSPLYLALKYNEKSVVELLLNKGANVNTINKKGKSPLHVAVKEGKETVVDLMLKHGANVNVANSIGDSTLHLAVLNGHIPIIQNLIRFGADITHKNRAGETPLTVAKVYHFELKEEIIKLLTTEMLATDSFFPNTNQSQVLQNFPHFIQHINQVGVYGDKLESVKPEFKYLKRLDDSGISGHLYETKLLSLILLRALNDNQIEHFLLGNNISGIGNIDDICLRYQVKDQQKPVVLFIQAKHKDTEKGKLTNEHLQSASGDYSLQKYCESYLKIQNRFHSDTKDPLFEGDFSGIECNLILYTPAKNIDIKKKPCREANDMCKKICYLINTGHETDVFQYDYNENDLEMLTKVIVTERIKKLGTEFISYITSVNIESKNILMIKLIAKYHVILAQKVLKVCETQDLGKNYRLWQFRREFFESNCKYLIALKRTFIQDISTKHCDTSTVSDQDIANLELFYENPCADTLSAVIGKLIKFDDKNKHLQLIEIPALKKNNKFSSLCKHKKKFATNENVVIEAAQKKMLSMVIKLSLSFGNLDMTLRGHNEKVQDKIKDIAVKLINLLEQYKDTKVVYINKNDIGTNKSISQGFININGGIGGAIGNLLVSDRDTKMLKFELFKSLPINAALLLNELKHKKYETVNQNLENFRIKVNISDFPQDSFDGVDDDKEQARNFLSRFWIYSDQAQHDKVEHILEHYITKFYNIDNEADQIKFKINPHDIFLESHYKIQEWWKKTGQVSYLDQNSDYFKQAKLVCVNNLLLTVINIMNNLEICRIVLKSNAQVIPNNENLNRNANISKIFKEMCGLLKTKNKSIDINTENQKEIMNILIENFNQWHENNSSMKKSSYVFSKRTGTSSVSGHLYKTKILCLVFLRSLNDEEIYNFYLGNNIKDIGAMNDICLRCQVISQKRPVLLFVQAKHKDNIGKGRLSVENLRNASGDFSLHKYFRSYLTIRERFDTGTDDPMFEGNFDDVDCYLVVYTPVQDCFFKKNTKLTINKKVYSLIGTGQNPVDVFKYDYDNIDIDFLTNISVTRQLEILGEEFFKILTFDTVNTHKIFSNKLITRYHVILGQKVLEQCNPINKQKPNQEYQLWKFRSDFFQNCSEYLVAFRNAIVKHLSKKRFDKSSITKHDQKNIETFLNKPSATTISKLIGKVVTYHDKTKKLQLVDDPTLSENKKIIESFNNIITKEMDVNEAIEIKLMSKVIKLPQSFGNTDIWIYGSESERQENLNKFADRFTNLLVYKNHNDIIEITHNLMGPEHYIELHLTSFFESFRSAIGNLIIFDTETKLLKFNLNCEELQENAAHVLKQLKFQNKELAKFRIKIKVAGFPKVAFDSDEYDEIQAKDFLDNLWFFVNQAKEDKVETILKNEINKYHDNKARETTTRYDKLFNSISIRCQDEMQNWSIQTNESPYLNRFRNIFERAQSADVYNLLLSVVNYLFMKKIYSVDINFNQEVGETNNLEKINRIFSQMSSSLFKIFDPQFDQFIDVELEYYDEYEEYIIRLEIHPEMEWVVLKISMSSEDDHCYIITKVGPGGGRCLIQDGYSFREIFVRSLHSTNALSQ